GGRADGVGGVERREILAPPALHGELRRDGAALTAIEPPELDEARAILGDLAAPSAEGLPVRAAAQAVAYARATQPAGVLPLVRLVLYRQGGALLPNDTPKTNPELTQTIPSPPQPPTLFSLPQPTHTAPPPP